MPIDRTTGRAITPNRCLPQYQDEKEYVEYEHDKRREQEAIVHQVSAILNCEPAVQVLKR